MTIFLKSLANKKPCIVAGLLSLRTETTYTATCDPPKAYTYTGNIIYRVDNAIWL
jgi:hypothetical protein